MGCRGTARSSEITRSESEYSPQQDEEARDSPAEPRNVTGSHEIGLILSARPTIGHGPSNHDSDVNSLNYFETGVFSRGVLACRIWHVRCLYERDRSDRTAAMVKISTID